MQPRVAVFQSRVFTPRRRPYQRLSTRNNSITWADAIDARWKDLNRHVTWVRAVGGQNGPILSPFSVSVTLSA